MASSSPYAAPSGAAFTASIAANTQDVAALAAAAIRIAGYGVAGPAAGHPALISLFYVIPLMGAGLALGVLMGYSPSAILARRRRAIEAPA